jgi:hypothetical protein
MKARELIVLAGTAMILSATTSLSSEIAAANPTCCTRASDCDDNNECDHSTSCGEYPGTCIPIPPSPSVSLIAR